MKRVNSKALCVLLLCVFFSSTSWAAYKPGEFKLGLGALPMNLYKVSDSAKGDIAPMSNVLYPIIGQGSFNIFGQTLLSPRLAYTIMPTKTDTGATDMTVAILSLPFTGSFASSENTAWSLGIGLMRIEQKGKGGTVVLNNGAGTATFAKPNYSSTTQQFTLEAGLNFALSEKMSFGLDLIVASAFTERRAMSGLFSFNYAFDGSGMGGGY